MKYIVLFIMLIIVLSSCERKSGQRVSTPIQKEKVVIISMPYSQTNGNYKYKVDRISEGVKAYVIIRDKYNIGDTVSITNLQLR